MAVDQKATSASWGGGGLGPLGPPLDPPLGDAISLFIIYICLLFTFADIFGNKEKV